MTRTRSTIVIIILHERPARGGVGLQSNFLAGAGNYFHRNPRKTVAGGAALATWRNR